MIESSVFFASSFLLPLLTNTTQPLSFALKPGVAAQATFSYYKYIVKRLMNLG